jgi:hypothetical protein
MTVPHRNSEVAKWTGRVGFTSREEEVKLARFIVFDQHPPSRYGCLGFNFSYRRIKTAFKLGSGATVESKHGCCALGAQLPVGKQQLTMGVRRRDYALSIQLQVERRPKGTLDSVRKQAIKRAKGILPSPCKSPSCML